MKKLVCVLLVITLPVFAGNESPAEENSKITEYESSEESIRIRSRRFGRNLGILGLAAFAGGMTLYHEYDKWSGVEVSLIGMGAAAIGCYIAFNNRKKLQK